MVVALAVIAVLVALEVAVFFGMGRLLGWPVMLGISGVTGVIGLFIIGMAIWR